VSAREPLNVIIRTRSLLFFFFGLLLTLRKLSFHPYLPVSPRAGEYSDSSEVLLVSFLVEHHHALSDMEETRGHVVPFDNPPHKNYSDGNEGGNNSSKRKMKKRKMRCDFSNVLFGTLCRNVCVCI
jgi:hypothetical protein